MEQSHKPKVNLGLRVWNHIQSVYTSMCCFLTPATSPFFQWLVCIIWTWINIVKPFQWMHLQSTLKWNTSSLNTKMCCCFQVTTIKTVKQMDDLVNLGDSAAWHQKWKIKLSTLFHQVTFLFFFYFTKLHTRQCASLGPEQYTCHDIVASHTQIAVPHGQKHGG